MEKLLAGLIAGEKCAEVGGEAWVFGAEKIGEVVELLHHFDVLALENPLLVAVVLLAKRQRGSLL
jgi:hypothetical protein